MLRPDGITWIYLDRIQLWSGQQCYRLNITLKTFFYSFSGQAKQSIQNTPWVMFRWRNHSCRDTKAKAISSTWKASFTIWRKTNKIIVRTIGRVRHIFSVQLYTGRLWLFILFLKPQYQYVSKFLEEADLRHAGDSFCCFMDHSLWKGVINFVYSFLVFVISKTTTVLRS